MINAEDLQGLLSDGVVVDESGDKVGKIGQVYLDDESGNPEWVTAKTGLFGGSETFIPIRDASASGNEVRVSYSKDKIKDAPRMDDAEGHLSPEQEQELYAYYGLGNNDEHQAGEHGVTGHTHGQGERGRAENEFGDEDRPTGDRGNRDRTENEFGDDGRDTSGPDTDGSMTRSEEQLRVGTEKVETGKARLRKYVVTENVTTTVPVEREVVQLEREPITEENRDQAMTGGDLTDEEHEVVLSEERVVVDKETVPVERVRLDTDTVTEEQQVTEEVRKEQIDTDLPDDPNDQADRR